MEKQEPDVCKMMQKLEVMDKYSEDMSYWEELNILNEEDFSSPEEHQSIAAAEKHLMDKFLENREKCQQGNNDPDNCYQG